MQSPILLVALFSLVFLFSCVAGIFFYVHFRNKQQQQQKKLHYQHIIGQVVEIVWGKECYCISAGGTGWRVAKIDGQWVGPVYEDDLPLLGKKVRVLDITGEDSVSVELMTDD